MQPPNDQNVQFLQQASRWGGFRSRAVVSLPGLLVIWRFRREEAEDVTALVCLISSF